MVLRLASSRVSRLTPLHQPTGAIMLPQTTVRCFALTSLARQDEASKVIEETPEVRKDSMTMRMEIKRLLPTLTSFKMPQPKRTLTPLTPYTLTISKLMGAGLHLGHSTSLWNPATLPFIFGTRAGISIINPEHTLAYLRRACAVLRDISFRGGIILFVGTRPGIQHVTVEAARCAEGYHVSGKWVPGTLTNTTQVLGRYAPPDPDDPTRPPRTYKPDILVVFNPIENENAIAEALLSHIPVVAITDTDYDPRNVMYPIPANDDSVRGVELVAKVLATAAKEGVLKRKMMLDQMDKNERTKKAQLDEKVRGVLFS
ncbi:ribosomal protein S2, flavodoxin-like domain-containing protein [Endogone sp. FLAS-F59071]|nr:ribosomal protein S2, flavodoxin-like domain-containing protein [Endogone sp. FLAS-F59071]|eukprot:RUS22913.1 ribosomal protein S2, flavodoxin-like domain-containing protein [Endogone sp. FLAS-F59071]